MWLFFAAIAGVFYTASGLISRHVIKNQKDSWAFSFYFSLVGAVVSLPFAINHFKIPHAPIPWLIALLVGLLIVGNNFLNFASSKYLPASISGAITKFRLVWVFVLGIIFIHEMFFWNRLIGTIITVLAGIVVIHSFKKVESVRGVLFAFSSTIFYAIVIVLYKFLFASFSPESLTFFATFLIPVILNALLMPHAWQRVTAILKTHGTAVFLSCACGAGANLAMNQGLALGNSSQVLVIIEAFLVFTLVGEHIILKEREGVLVKVIAVILATAGAILIRMR